MRAAEVSSTAREVTLAVNGVELVAEADGALWWPGRETLVVADLHLEKGSAYAARGQLLPPYDSAATLDRLAAAIARRRPRRVVCLGDSFHDAAAAERLAPALRARLAALAAAHEWVWIAGNHDPAPPRALGGQVLDALVEGALVFRHAPAPGKADAAGIAGEVVGHFHPKARVRLAQRRVSARCFAGDGRRLVLPAFGAYAGGLDVLAPALAGLFGNDFQVALLGARGVYRFPRSALVPIA